MESRTIERAFVTNTGGRQNKFPRIEFAFSRNDPKLIRQKLSQYALSNYSAWTHPTYTLNQRKIPDFNERMKVNRNPIY